MTAAPASKSLPAAAMVCPADDFGLLQFDGQDAAPFLQGQLSSDVLALAPGAGQWSTYNSAKGRVLANLWVWRNVGEPARFEALVAADLAEALRKRLSMFVLRAKVTIADRSTATRRFGVAGPGATAVLTAAIGHVPAGTVVDAASFPARVVALPDGRYVVIAEVDDAVVVEDALARHAQQGDGDAWRRHGIAAGVPLVTAATTDHFVAQALNWDALGGLDFRKGCYPGQEIVARTRYLGRLKERLFLFHVDAPAPAAGDRFYSPAFGDQACGTVVNAAAAPDGGADLLAVVQLAATESPGLALGAPDGPAPVPRPLPYALPDLASPRARPA
jgi:folate-binding protein YgfZ